MIVAAGIPVLMPLAFVAFVVYFLMEKLLFLRYYKAPSHLDDGVTQVCTSPSLPPQLRQAKVVYCVDTWVLPTGTEPRAGTNQRFFQT